jgi:hypothetical protein
MRHNATNEASYTISQDANQVVSGKAYNLACEVNVPATTDPFSFTLQVQWLSGNAIRGTSTVTTVSGATDGWRLIRRTMVAPGNANKARIRMVVAGLSSTFYVDGCTFVY